MPVAPIHPSAEPGGGTSDASVTVNGQPRSLNGVGARTSLLDWVRGLGLTGAKEGCGEGECGACAMLILRAEPEGARPSSWRAFNSCLTPAWACAGAEVTTVEGCGNEQSPHPAQAAMAAAGGSQCGYCTPGFVISMVAEQQRSAACGTPFDEHALAGNLCRCTGYRPICEAARTLGYPSADDPLWQRTQHPASPATTTGKLPPATAPAALDVAAVAPVDPAFDPGRLLRPKSLAEVHDLLAAHPQARLLAGSTDIGVEISIQGQRPELLIAIDHLDELREYTRTETEIVLGAALTLTEIDTRLAGSVPLLAQLLPQFASPLIRNAATLGGNLATASPVGDSAPALIALAARVRLSSSAGVRELPVEDFFTDYRATVLSQAEVIQAVVIPLPLAPLTAFTKIAKRRLDDISSVAAGIAITLSEPNQGGAREVISARIGLGGVAATPVRARGTEEALIGATWSIPGVTAAAAALADEGTPMDDHRASAAYRRAMLGNLLPAMVRDCPDGQAAPRAVGGSVPTSSARPPAGPTPGQLGAPS